MRLSTHVCACTRSFVSFLAIVTLAAATSCGTADDPSIVTASLATDAPVVHGTVTASWPGIGALVANFGYGWDAFCTGTLISDRWVMSAAHCADSAETGIPATSMAFFIGPDVAGAGNRYAVDRATIHPQWDSQNIENDISLLHLAVAVPASVATPIAINSVAVTNGTGIKFVGYGVSSADGQGGGGGSGTKRYGVSTIDHVYATSYHYSPGTSSAMSCNGDSGGPDLVGASGQEKVAGITSYGDAYCSSDAVSTRVDAFKTWIIATTGITTSTGCNPLGGSCGSQACTLGPTSGNYVCQPSSNLTAGQTCNPAATSPSCVDGAACADLSDGAVCYQLCVQDDDCTSGKKCALGLGGVADLGACVTSCAITGGSCPTGKACYPKTSNVDVCLVSNNATRSSGCDPDPTSAAAPLACADGLVCAPSGSGNQHSGACRDFCTGAADCASGESCYALSFPGAIRVGYCDAAAGSCTSGAARCNGDVSQTCKNGSWTVTQDCGLQSLTCRMAGAAAICTTPTCACDADRSCDASCACDVDCPCSCDTTYSCDDSCTCDPECLDGTSTGGCRAVDATLPAPVFMAVLLLMLGRRRRR
jgi:secreted trypsin-like serine protease